MAVSKARLKQIAWWASKVYEQADEFADALDPKRTRTNRVANKLDAICRLTREIHFELTGEFPSTRKRS
jgi:hypothetical protein